MTTPLRQPNFHQGTLRRTKTINLAKTNEEVNHQLETTIWMKEELKRKSDSLLDQEIRERIEILVTRAAKKTRSDNQKQMNKIKHLCVLLSDIVEETIAMVEVANEPEPTTPVQRRINMDQELEMDALRLNELEHQV